MRTTVDISDELYVQLRSRAAARGTSVKSLIHDAVRQSLSRGKSPEGDETADFPMIRSERPGTATLTPEMMHEAEMDGF